MLRAPSDLVRAMGKGALLRPGLSHSVPSQWRVLVTDGLAEAGASILRRQAEIVEDRSALGQIDGWIVRSRTRIDGPSLTAGAPRLRVVGRAGVGLDNIDLPAARAAGVVVVNAPQAVTTAVAELTVGLLLALARQIPMADAALRRGEWAKDRLGGQELRGKTLGLVGVGRIGREVARLAEAFGMRCLGTDPFLSHDSLRAAGVEPADLEALLPASDYVSLHLPLTDDTRGLFSAEILSRMKPGARLVCVARGGVVDEDALLAALESGHLAGAALDVFQIEPPGDSPVLRHPRLIATPHLGAQTAEAQDRVAIDIVEEVLTVLRGEEPRWRVA